MLAKMQSTGFEDMVRLVLSVSKLRVLRHIRCQCEERERESERRREVHWERGGTGIISIDVLTDVYCS